MTIEQGMNKLAKKLGNGATFAIQVMVWNGRENHHVKGNNSTTYQVWDGCEHYPAPTIAKAVALCILSNTKPKTQDPDDALAGIAS